MTQMAEFEEKTYEKYFGQELVQGRRMSFSPGQIAESVLGFDDAFMVPWHIFLLRFRHLMSRPWSRLSGVDRNEFNELANHLSQHLPKFRLNFFVQYKRPEYVSGSRGTERVDWKCAYYRYKISPDQQRTLERLHSLSVGRAVVVYASPVLWRKADLFTAAEKRRVISCSNIVSVDKLVGHGRFTYIESGGKGKAYSEPNDIEGVAIEQLIQEGMRQPGLPFNQHVNDAARLIKEALEEDHDGKRLLAQARSAVVGDTEQEAAPAEVLEPFWDALTTIEAFSDAFDVSLYAMG